MGVQWQYRSMWDSPGGREIRHLDGDGVSIERRGDRIKDLGERMQRAAETLRLIASEQIGEGDSLDAVKDQAEDVHADLKTAGERYTPSGAAIAYYGRRVQALQPSINAEADGAAQAWSLVQGRASTLDNTDDVPDDADGGSTARDEAETRAQGRLDSALEEWETHARAFDRYYDSWESAYEYARGQLQGANEDGVSDSLLDNSLPFFEAVVAVLEVVAVILVVAALIVGGPLLGVLAAVVALIVLVGTIVLAAGGRKDGKDVALAALGVIPFGKLGKLVNLADLASAGAKIPKLSGFKNLFLGADDFTSMSRHLSTIDDRARIAWNMTTGGRPFDQITMGSRFIARIQEGAPYFAERMGNVVIGPRSREMFVARLTGYGDNLQSVHDFGMRLPLLTHIQGASTMLGLTSFAADRVSAAETSARVDSWR